MKRAGNANFYEGSKLPLSLTTYTSAKLPDHARLLRLVRGGSDPAHAPDRRPGDLLFLHLPGRQAVVRRGDPAGGDRLTAIDPIGKGPRGDGPGPVGGIILAVVSRKI